MTNLTYEEIVQLQNMLYWYRNNYRLPLSDDSPKLMANKLHEVQGLENKLAQLAKEVE